MIWLGCYIGTIAAANWAIVTFGLVPVGFGLYAPAGVYFAGLAFTLRDLTQEDAGRPNLDDEGVGLGRDVDGEIQPARPRQGLKYKVTDADGNELTAFIFREYVGTSPA